MSFGISKLGCTEIHFIEPGTKVNGAYSPNIVLAQKLLPDILQIAKGECFCLSTVQCPGTSSMRHRCFSGAKGARLYSSLCGHRIHSFIHYRDLYSAPSRLLLRSAPDPCTAKKKSFETRVECVRKNGGENFLEKGNPIPHRGPNPRECTGLGCGCTSKRNKE